MVFKVLDKNSSGSAARHTNKCAVKSKIMSNRQLD